MSDWIGRKNTYYTFFVLGIILYASMPTLGHMGAAGLFVIAVCVILTMYGGGFSTVPAYLADVFGTQMVGAIHGPAVGGGGQDRLQLYDSLASDMLTLRPDQATHARPDEKAAPIVAMFRLFGGLDPGVEPLAPQ